MQVVNGVVSYHLADDGENVVLTAVTDNPIYQPPFAPQEDSGASFIVSSRRTAYGYELDLVEVRLQHSATSCKGDYYGFFRCSVHFDSDASAIFFSRADLDRPLPAANRELAQANDRILTDFLGKLHEADLVTGVKTAIAQELPSGSPTGEDIAKSVFLSPRALNRRLTAMGTNYSQLLEAVRYELAEQYVADPSLSLSELSFLLGFSELSAFSRAFRRWSGQSPSAAREAAH